MEDQQVNPSEGQEQETPSFTFVDESEVIEAQQVEQQVAEPQVEEYVEEQTQSYEPSTEETQSEHIEDYSQEDVEGAVLNYLSERLGSQIESIDDLIGSATRERA